MKMLSAFKYRLYPKPEQEKRLDRSLFLLCNLYNNLKAEEIRRYREEHKSTSKTRFRRLALEARKEDGELQTAHSQVVQNVGDRIHRSFRNFFERRARFPRWKKPHRYNSLTYPQSGFKLSPEKGLYLSGDWRRQDLRPQAAAREGKAPHHQARGGRLVRHLHHGARSSTEKASF